MKPVLVVNTSEEERIRRQADRVVDEFPNDALEILAADMVSDSYEQEGLDIAVTIAAELLQRAAAGVRKWPGPNPVHLQGE